MSKFGNQGGRAPPVIFLNTLNAFLLRELRKQFGRSRLGYFWAVAEPGGIVAILTVLHAFARGEGKLIYGESPIVFFVFGAIPYFLFANCVNAPQGVSAFQNGLFNYPQVRPFDVMLANAVIEALLMMGVGAIFLAGWAWLGNGLQVYEPLLLLGSTLGLFILGFSLGLCFEVFGQLYPDMQRVFSLIMRPMFFISGIFFSIEMVPVEYRAYLIWNPVLHCVDLVRDAVLEGYVSPASPFYVIVCAMVLLFVGLAAYRRHLHELI